MAEFAAAGPLAGLELPLEAGGARLEGRAPAGLLSVAPYRGGAGGVAAVLGAALPGPGESADAEGARLLWMGLDLWFVETAEPAALAGRLAAHAAVTDQSDGWAAFVLSGPAAREVLARLVPVDLDPDAFADGATARAPLRHVAASLTRRGAAFEILVMRSFARTAHHEIGAAMRAVAARAAL